MINKRIRINANSLLYLFPYKKQPKKDINITDNIIHIFILSEFVVIFVSFEDLSTNIVITVKFNNLYLFININLSSEKFI